MKKEKRVMKGRGSLVIGLAALLVGSTSALGANSAITEGSFEGIGNGSFYVGLDYSPAFSKIRDFEIMESNGETKAVYPYKKDGKSVKLKAENFDWTTQDPKIGFKDNMLVALEGSVGYGIGGARVELEVGYERFKIKGNRDSGNKEEGSDAVYLLAKELAYDVLNTRTSELKTALGNVKGVDIVRFATELKNKHSKIDGQLCKDGSASGGDNTAGECAKSGSNKTGLKSALGIKGRISGQRYHMQVVRMVKTPRSRSPEK